MSRTTTARTTTTTTARKGNTVKSTTTTARKTAPAAVKPTARKSTAPATVKPTARKAAPAAPVTYRGVAVDGYITRWEHGGYDLLKTTDASADRPAWLVRCNDHGTVATVENTREGDACGSKRSRALWCAPCTRAAAAAAARLAA